MPCLLTHRIYFLIVIFILNNMFWRRRFRIHSQQEIQKEIEIRREQQKINLILYNLELIQKQLNILKNDIKITSKNKK
jgi:hypothetical protein